MDTVTDTVMDAGRLAAFVDGELSPEDAAAVVLHLADCPGDRAHVDALMEAGMLFAAAYAEPLHQGMPERLRALIYPASPDLAAPRAAPRRAAGRASATSRPSRRQAAVWGIATLAASALLAIGIASRPETGILPAAGPVAAGSALHAALEGASSGPAGDGLVLVATFHDASGRPCREFEARIPHSGVLTHAIACRETTGGWTTIAAFSEAVAVASGPRQAFVPAGGADSGDLDVVLDRIGAGLSLTPREEAALIRRGWES